MIMGEKTTHGEHKYVVKHTVYKIGHIFATCQQICWLNRLEFKSIRNLCHCECCLLQMTRVAVNTSTVNDSDPSLQSVTQMDEESAQINSPQQVSSHSLVKI